MNINYLDLFSGIGGFSLGIKNAGINFNYHAFSEINKYAIGIYRNNFNGEFLNDIRSIRKDRLPKLDLITFGFPCQDLSIAGKREGLKGSRSGLFFEAIKIIRDTKPTYFIFENVRGLFSSNKGRDWITCLQEISNIGYDGQWQLVNTSWFLPQNRERIYFVGNIRGRSRPQIFPIREENNLLFQGKLKCIVNKGCHSGTIYDSKGISPTLVGGSSGYSPIIKIYNKKNHMDSLYDSKGISPTLCPYNRSRRLFKVGDTYRKLTPIECERLQGFTDNWTKYGKDEKGNSFIVSDTQRYKLLGNAVTVKMVEEIIKKLFWA